MQDAHLGGLERKVKDNALKKKIFLGKICYYKAPSLLFRKKKF